MEEGLEQVIQGLLAVLLGLDFAVHRLENAGNFALFRKGR